MVDRATDNGLGGRLGARLTALLAQGKVATTGQLTGHYAGLANLIQEQFFALTGAELRRTIGRLYGDLAKHPDTDPSVRATLQFLSEGKGQFATMLGQAVTGQAVGIGLGGLLTNLLQPAVGRAIAGSPHLPLSVSDAVQALVRGLADGVDARFDVLQQGMDDNRLDVMKELARPRLSPGMWQDAVNRGLASYDFAQLNLQHLGYSPPDAQHILDMRRTLHSPQELADLVTFGVLTEEQAAGDAAKSGMTREDFHTLVLGNGQPPSTSDLMEAYRRKIIDKRRLERGITQGPVRNEWFDMLESLRYQPMSVAAAIEAAVQGHITDAQSRDIAEQNGLLPEHWQPLYDTAGNPPGVQEMIDMWQRGVIDRATLVQGIRESRLKNKWIEPVIAAGETQLPQDTIRHLVSLNLLTAEQGTALLLKRGYAPDIAAALIKEAHATKTQQTRELSAAQIVALYENQAIDQASALDMLTAHGYDADTANQLLQLADLRHAKTYQDQVISRVRAAYLASRIDEATAATDMDALRVPPGQRDSLLALWELEKAIPTKQLTEAQLRAAARASIITWPQYAAKLESLGYATEDIGVLVALYAPRPSAPSQGA